MTDSEQRTTEKPVHWALRDKVPVWLHISTIVITLIATVVIGPWLNSQFERQKIKSAFVIDTLTNLNSLTTDLAVSVSKLNYCIANKTPSCEQQTGDARQALARLQWKALELRTVLNKREDKEAVLDFSEKLDHVRECLDAPPGLDSSQKLNRSMRPFTISSVNLVGRIATDVGIAVTPVENGKH